MSLFGLKVNVHAACPCPCWMSISMMYAHVNDTCSQCCISMLLVHAAYPCLNAACPHCMLMLHPCCKSMLQAHAACPCFLSMMHAHAAYPCYLSVVHVHFTCPIFACLCFFRPCSKSMSPCCMSMSPCCMSLLHAHAAWTFRMNMLHQHNA